MSAAPSVVQEIRQRTPLPQLVPPKLSDKANPPYSVEWQSKIADLKCHPLLESTLHLMNDDLFSAHFLLRKMQEDEWGKWLHACLHLAEGDLEKNAKLWYEQVDGSVLAHYWGEPNANDKAVEGMRKIQKVLHQKQAERDEKEETGAKEIKWKELVCILDVLEKKFGWEEMDGSNAYTHDDDPSHKSMVLGEGWRNPSKGHFQ